MSIQVIDGVVESTRNTAWRLLGVSRAEPLRTGLAVVLGRRRFGRLLLGPQLDVLRRAILRAFLAGGPSPSAATLAKALDRPEPDIRMALAQLAARGLLALEENGDAIKSAFPFSPPPAPYRVVLPGRQEAYAPSALDALGISLLAGGVGVIHGTCPHSGQSIAVTIRARRVAERSPEHSVIAVATDPREGALESLCRRAHFFASRVDAEAWLAEQRPLGGRVLEIGSALLLAKRLFDDSVALPS